MIKELNIDDMRRFHNSKICGEDSEILSIIDARKMDFQRKTLVLGFLFFVYCYEGKAEFILSDRSCVLTKGQMLIGLYGRILKNCRLSDDFRGQMIVVSEGYCWESMVGLSKIWPYLLYLFKHPIISLTPSELLRLRGCLNMLFTRSKERSYSHLKEVQLSLLRVFYYDVCTILSSRMTISDMSSQRSYIVFDQFINLVRLNCYKERSVNWYSSEMFLTPKYLSEVIKKVSGRTAGQWIADIVLIRIKHLLRSSSLSIKEITIEMNFPNQSSLGKFFKKHVGISPLEYRNE